MSDLVYKPKARMIVSEEGLPDLILTQYIRLLSKSYARETVRAYVRCFMAWLEQWRCDFGPDWQSLLTAAPRKIRNHVTEYLEHGRESIIYRRSDPETGSYKLIKNESMKSDLRCLLSAMKILFEYLKDTGRYNEKNPMLVDDKAHRERARDEQEFFLASNGRPRMSAESGVDAPLRRRQSSNYFRMVGEEWLPSSIDDPQLPFIVMQAGEEYDWSERDSIISSLMFETGARISEICGMSVGGWAAAGFRNSAFVRNKGGGDRELKRIIFSEATAGRLRKYFDEAVYPRLKIDFPEIEGGWAEIVYRYISRKQAIPEGIEKTRVFATIRNKNYTADMFRRLYWRPALVAAGIYLQPHAVRHWFVTQALINIEEIRDEKKRKSEEGRFIEYMAWKTGPEMLERYAHASRKRIGPEILQKMQAEMFRARAERDNQTQHNVRPGVTSPHQDPDLDFIVGMSGPRS